MEECCKNAERHKHRNLTEQKDLMTRLNRIEGEIGRAHV